MPSFRKFRERTYLSFTPILTPRAAGKAMMVNPKILFLHVVHWITGENHPTDCDCAVCQYRADDSAKQQVQAQRNFTRVVLGKEPHLDPTHIASREPTKTTQGDLTFLVNEDRPLLHEEAVWWAQWMTDHFWPVDDRNELWLTTVNRLDELPADMLADTLLEIAENNCYITVDLSDPVERSRFSQEWQGYGGDPQDQLELLLVLSSVDSNSGFHSPRGLVEREDEAGVAVL